MPATVRQINPDPERHSRKCTICNHEKREEIDEKYLEWFPIGEICNEFGVEERNLYRHVNALGLDEKQRQNSARYLQRIMARIPLDQITPSDALTAARLLLQMDGKLITRVDQKTEVTNQGMSREERLAEYRQTLEEVARVTASVNRQQETNLENDTPEGSSTETKSTRHPLGPKKF